MAPSILAMDFSTPSNKEKRKSYSSLYFSNLCDNFVKKLASEIRKCCQLQGDKVTLTIICWRRLAFTLAMQSEFLKFI